MSLFISIHPNRIVYSGLAATSLMTIFSYLVSELEVKNFKEPELLADLLRNERKELKDIHLLVGWITHYGMGITWAMVHELLFQYSEKTKPSTKTGLLLGCLSGLTGIAVWKHAFKVSSRPPLIDFGGFYSHLFLAHLIFSMTVTVINGKNIINEA